MEHSDFLFMQINHKGSRLLSAPFMIFRLFCRIPYSPASQITFGFNKRATEFSVARFSWFILR